MVVIRTPAIIFEINAIEEEIFFLCKELKKYRPVEAKPSKGPNIITRNV